LPVIGFLSSRSANESARLIIAFEKGLQTGSRSDRQAVTVKYRWAEGHLNRLPALAAEFVQEKVAVIVAAGGSSSAIAASKATSSVPVVFVIGVDPVKLGLVASLSRPGGNATGITIISADLAPKRLDLLRELAPTGNSFAVLTNPDTPEGQVQVADVLAVGQKLGLKLKLLSASDEFGIEAAFAALSLEHIDALLVGSDPIYDVHREKLVALANQLRRPAIYQFREFVEAGGLMSYGPDIADAYRQAGVYAGQIIRGNEPANLPVLQPTRFELILNLKTAAALGITIPPTLLARADEVIE
jgi:putative tryptophan/tyrosine transport system substrate-binding protein